LVSAITTTYLVVLNVFYSTFLGGFVLALIDRLMCNECFRP